MLRTHVGLRRVWIPVLTAFTALVAAVALTAAAVVEPLSHAEPATYRPVIATGFEHGAELSPGTVDWTVVGLLDAAERQARIGAWYAAVAENERVAAEAAAAAAAARDLARQRAQTAAQTVAPAREVAQAGPAPVPAPPPVAESGDRWGSTGAVNGYPCGGALPTCRVLECESGGNPFAENRSSSASGLWQIIDGTWNGFGGYGHAASAPWDVQNDKAAQLWAGGAGRNHWRACL